MKQAIILFLLAVYGDVQAQNVGIGSVNPQKKLTVNGSILLDENNTNDGGLDSAALLFGTNGSVGIASKKTPLAWQNGLSFFTSSQNRMTITPAGLVGINVISPSSLLHVGGSIRSTLDMWAGGLGRFDGRVAIGSAGLPEYKLHNNGHSFLGGNLNVTGITTLSDELNVSGPATVEGNFYANGAHSYFDGTLATTGNAFINATLSVTGDGIIDNNFRVNGRVGINGATHGSYGLMVNNANSYFDGNATVQGNATIQGSTNLQGDVTIQGNGHVRSNGSSSLRIGFATKSVSGAYNPHQEKVFTVDLPAFDGSADNIRVNISSFEPFAGSHTSDFKWYVYDVDSATDTCKIRIINQTNDLTDMAGIFYLMIVVKD